MGAGRQLLLQDDELVYDSVGNPTEIRDWRIASEWPAGAKPVTKKAQYDDLNRVSRVDYQFEGGDDTWTSPFAAENSGTADLQDPRRAKPSPHVDFPKRLAWQTFEYDWLGNTKKTDDDARGFYDRSIGPITNDAGKPYQLKSADNTALGGTRTGKLETQYDAAGNLARLQVKRNGTCLPAGSSCSQVFGYEWDEVGRLSRAKRWDVATLPAITDPLPAGAPDADLAFGYDAGDQRVLKTAKDGAGAERHTVYVFESLELRRAVFAPPPGPSEVPDYELSKWTEVPYLYAHGVRLARVAWEEPDVPTVGGAQTHVLLELGDHLGSTSVVLDHVTGELVERGTHQAYGGSESDYRPERWKGFREDYRFTGKEEDVEVGLQYFGARFYAPLLGRWISPDPLAVHEVGEADLNLYGYAEESPLRNIDPLGLQSQDVGENLRQLDAGVRTNGQWNVEGPRAESGHEPPAPSGTTFLQKMEIRGDVRATPQAAPSRPGSRPGEEVLGLLGHVAIGAGKGTAIGAGVATACGATGPGAPACMAAAAVYGGYSLWRDRQKLLSDPYEAAETIGTFATVVPSAKFTRAQLASVPEHALYSGPKGRTVGELRAAGMKDAHHVIQDAAVRDRPGYDTNAAPGVQLPGPANTPGTPHHAATTVQRQAGGGTYAAERRIGYKALRKAGVSVAESRGLIQSADAYFGKLGVTPSTPTRVPKNRAKSR